jgi:transposase
MLTADIFVCRNKVKTDGVAIDFIFKKAKNEPNNTTPADWRNFLERATIWGVDPGAKDLIVAVDGDDVDVHAELPFSTREPHRVRSTSTREYYHLCGVPQAARKRASWKRASPEAAAIIDGIPTLKTTQLQTLLTATTYIFNHYHIITMYFDQGLRSNRQKFKTYTKRQRAINEIARRLTFGSNKYSLNAPPNNPPVHNNAVVRWTPRPNTNQANDANQRIFIAFGNGSWGNLRGQLPSATKRLVRRLREVSKLTGGNVVMVMIDEYLTSKICANCFQRSLYNVEERSLSSGSKIHAVLKCNSCSKTWNRDIMAAKNMRFLFRYMATHNNNRPPMFHRPAQTQNVVDSLEGGVA